MKIISVGEILKIHGKWIESNQLNKQVAEKLDVSKRHAFSLIKKAYEGKEILRVEVGKYVLYGLAEFGSIIPEASKPSMLNLFSYLKWRTQHNEAKRKRELKELDNEYQKLLKEALSNEDEWKP